MTELTGLKQEEGLLLALYPDFILVIRSGMNKDANGLYISPGMLDTAKIFDLDNLTCIVERPHLRQPQAGIFAKELRLVLDLEAAAS